MTTREPNRILLQKSRVGALIPQGAIAKRTFWYWLTVTISCLIGVAIVLRLASNISTQRLTEFSNPAILGTLSLIITLHARNMSISDRIRALGGDANKAMFDGLPNQRVAYRLDSIADQIRDLYTRYRLNLFSLMAVAANLLILPIIVLSIPLSLEADDAVSSLTIFLICVSTVMFTFAAISTIYDLFFSMVTLETDIDCTDTALGIKGEQTEDIDPDDLAAVVHFNRQYHKIWYVLRVKLEIATDPQTKKDLEELFFTRYIGLLHEEFHFFCNNLLPESLFGQWLECLRENALVRFKDKKDEERVFGTRSMLDWWRENSAEYRDSRFRDFLNKAFEITRHEEQGRNGAPYTLDELLAQVLGNRKNVVTSGAVDQLNRPSRAATI